MGALRAERAGPHIERKLTRCKKCRTKAVIRLPRHNTAFCGACFDQYVLEQVRRAVHSEKMLMSSDRVAVAISGGKDSLALWDILIRLGYETVGLHINLGIGAYSGHSQAKAEAFAQVLGAPLVIRDLNALYGLGVPELAQESRRPTCSACGVMKRHHFNQLAQEAGCTVLTTGHNLDDEAARLLGNVLRWQQEYLDKQSPTLPSTHPSLPKKVKPLFRLTEREMAAYCVLRKIDYIVEECPKSHNAKQLVYKDVLNRLEAASPGTKQSFYQEFLKREKPPIAELDTRLKSCIRCGQATTAEVCAHCRLVEALPGKQGEREKVAKR